MRTQTLLAHHSTGAWSTLAYSRDALSGPLRKLESLLHQVRTGKFCPDSTRSGYWKASSGPECAESSLGSWDFLSKDTKDTLQELPGLQRPGGRNLQDTDEPLPPDSHIGQTAKGNRRPGLLRKRGLAQCCTGGRMTCCRRGRSRPRHLGSGLGPRTLHGRPASSRPCCPRGIHSNILPLAIQTALKASSSELGSGSDSGKPPLLTLPEGWRAIQNVKSTMLHLYKEGAAALKCGAWISHNFTDMERPTTVWVRCRKCFG